MAYVLECEGKIYGVGTTGAEAINDARAHVDVDPERVVLVTHPDQYYPAGACAVWPATDRLVQAVLRDPHGTRWGWSRQHGAVDVRAGR